MRDAVEEVDGAVDRVDDPGEAARAASAPRLLAEERVVGPQLEKSAADERLGVAVDLRHDIHRGGLHVGDLDDAAARLGDPLGSLHGDAAGDGEERGVSHGWRVRDSNPRRLSRLIYSQSLSGTWRIPT